MLEGKVTRRSFLNKSMKGILGVAALFSLPLGYSNQGERFWYKVNQVPISFNRLPSAFQGLRLVQFSDVHIGHYFAEQHLLKIVEMIQSLRPDMICFTGDLVEQDGSVLQACIPVLSKLKAPLGKWAVPGNHDYRGNIHQVVEGLEKADFEVLINRNKKIIKEHQSITMIGVDDSLNGNPNMIKAISGTHENEFKILLSHIPDYADIAKHYPIDIQLSGHSHGGQIRIPFYGSVITPIGAKKYIDGLYHIQDSNLVLYVNRGIGTTVMPLRFACRPEITLFTFHTK